MKDEIAKLMIATSVVDGHAHENEGVALATVMQGFGVTEKKVLSLVDEASKVDNMIDWVADAVSSLSATDEETKKMALGSMMLIAIADGVVDPKEVVLISTVADALGMELPEG